MKQLFFCILITLLCISKSGTLFAQINASDSIALINLYDSTKGKQWTNHTNWHTAKPVSTWFGILVQGKRVTEINLNSNNLVGHIPSTLGNITFLTSLALYTNQLSGNIPATLSNLSHLVYLGFANNKLTGKIPVSLGNLSNLQTLDLYNNQLSGTIPSSLGNLTNLKNLYLSINQLTGRIPSSLGNLVNLNDMLLGVNQLTGKIPSSFGNFVNLTQRLGLARNHLKGNIPKSLDHIPAGAFFYFFGNQFTFTGIEHFVQVHPNTSYSPQAIIKLQKNGTTLSVDAGGTLSKNTYYWYKNGSLVATDTGNSSFTTTGAGTYNVAVTNSVATALTLYSDTVTTASFAADENIIAKTTTKTFIYPNPANKIIHLSLNKPAGDETYCVVYNMQSKTIMQEKISKGASTADYSVSKLSSGNYVLVVLEKGEKIHEEKFAIIH